MNTSARCSLWYPFRRPVKLLTGIGLGVFLVWLGPSALRPAGLFQESPAGMVTGTVLTRAVDKPKPPPRYYLGPRRSGRGPSTQPEGGPTDVIVFLEDVPGQRTFTPPAKSPQMLQKDETFIPHVLPVLVGTTVEFPNADDFYHNVFSVIAGNRFDLGRYPKGRSTRQTFTKPALVVVRCEIHPGMKAFIMVLKNPYFAVPDEEGRFRIPNVPAGTYTLKAWHPIHPEQARTVTIPPSGEVTVGFTF
jgi:hypothetical protein